MSNQIFEKPRLKLVVHQHLAAELGVGIDEIEDTLYTFLNGRKTGIFNFQDLDYAVLALTVYGGTNNVYTMIVLLTLMGLAESPIAPNRLIPWPV